MVIIVFINDLHIFSLIFLLNVACLAQKQQIKYQLYGLWFNLQTVEDGDLESAIQMTELVRSC